MFLKLTLGALGLAGWLVAAILYFDIVPLKDDYSFVMTYATTSERRAHMDILAANGHQPTHRLITPQVDRVMYDNGRLILNVVDKEMLSKMGDPSHGLIVVVKDPIQAMERAQRLFSRRKIDSVVVTDDGVPPSSMQLTASSNMPGRVFGFRKWAFKMEGPPPERW